MEPTEKIIPWLNLEDQDLIFYGKNQKEYKPLPMVAVGYSLDEGHRLSCWVLNFYERLKILFSGRLYLMVNTYNEPLQPLYLSVDCPVEKKEV